jgi:hypothetical protein
MAQTDARAGFRLPWSSERSNIEQTETDQVDSATSDGAGGWPETDTAPTGDQSTQATDAPADGGWGSGSATPDAAWGSGAETSEPATTPEPPRGPSPKKPSKFLADLTKAMQTAAEEERNKNLSQFQADAKAYVEQIHERSATEANTLRRQADDDVAAVREWSKAEIARIREETETKITARKGRLETEIEQHAAMIEREIELVQGRVAGFEDEMARFFERLLAEDDPTHFATMAENLPEPPSFDDMPVLDPVEFAAQIEYEAAIADPVVADEVETETPTEAETEGAAQDETAWGEAEPVVADEVATDEPAEAEPVTEGELQVGEAETDVEAVAETATEADSGSAPATAEFGATEGGWEPDGTTAMGELDPNVEFPNGEAPEGFEIDREAAFAAIQAAAEAAASAEVATDAAARAEAVADIAIEIVGSHDEEDARVNALGLTPDFESAEAEAATATGEGEEIQEIGDDALAARLAGLVPGKAGKSQGTDTKATQVVVVGLVSVASIASFKRHLGRLSGVQSVGVSSGPDGEFLFAVTHSADLSLRDAIPSLPSFQARVTGSSEGVLNVAAHDPEADN